MSVVIVSGSQRPDSQSLKVSEFLQNFLKENFKVEGHLINLAEEKFPFWSPTVQDELKSTNWETHNKALKKCDAAILVTPEWNGMATPAIKNFMLLTYEKQFANKPVLLVSVSAARGGAYPIAELRMSSYKNTFACFIPEHLIVRNVESVLNDRESANEEDKYLRERIPYTLKILLAYAKALAPLREGDLFDYKTFGNGM